MPTNWRALLDVLPYAAAGFGRGGREFAQGYGQSQELLRRGQLQERDLDLDVQREARQQQMQDFQMGRLQRADEAEAREQDLAGQQQALGRLTAFDKFASQRGEQLGAEADDPLEAQNRLTMDLLNRSQVLGLPPSVQSGALPNMTAMVTKGAKSDANTLLESYSKMLPAETRAQGLDDQHISFEWGAAPARLQKALQQQGHAEGQPFKPSQLRSLMSGGIAINPATGQPWQPAAAAPVKQSFKPGSIEEFFSATPEQRPELARLRAQFEGIGKKPEGEAMQQVSSVDPLTGDIVTSLVPRRAGEVSRKPGPVLPESKYKAAGFADRLEQAEPVLKSVEKAISKMSPVSFELQEFADRPALQTSEFQDYMQASRSLINAVLRRESGAVISPSEFDNAKKQYLPYPGDTPQVLKKKELDRRRYFANLKNEAGQAYRQLPVEALGGQSGDEMFVRGPDGRLVRQEPR